MQALFFCRDFVSCLNDLMLGYFRSFRSVGLEGKWAYLSSDSNFACLLTGDAYRSLLLCWCFRATFTELPKITVCLLDAITSGAQGLHRIQWTKRRVICGNRKDGICLHFCLISIFRRGVHGIFALLGCYAV
jgi:hypothetical protein